MRFNLDINNSSILFSIFAWNLKNLDLDWEIRESWEITINFSFKVSRFSMQILSKDSVTVAVDAVVYFRISNATISITNVEDASRSTKLLAQTTLRNILGTRTLAEMLSDRDAISLQMQVMNFPKTSFIKTSFITFAEL